MLEIALISLSGFLSLVLFIACCCWWCSTHCCKKKQQQQQRRSLVDPAAVSPAQSASPHSRGGSPTGHQSPVWERPQSPTVPTWEEQQWGAQAHAPPVPVVALASTYRGGLADAQVLDPAPHDGHGAWGKAV